MITHFHCLKQNSKDFSEENERHMMSLTSQRDCHSLSVQLSSIPMCYLLLQQCQELKRCSTSNETKLETSLIQHLIPTENQ